MVKIVYNNSGSTNSTGSTTFAPADTTSSSADPNSPAVVGTSNGAA